MMKKSKGTNKYYWTEDTDKYLKQYLAETNDDIRNDIFNQHLLKPLTIISETMTARYGQYLDYDEFKYEVLAFITSYLPKVDYTRSNKAYSILTLAATHYVMQANQIAYKRHNLDITNTKGCNPLQDDEDDVDMMTNAIDHEMTLENKDSTLPKDYDFDRLRLILIAKVGNREILNMKDCGVMTRLALRKALTILGSDKFMHMKCIRKWKARYDTDERVRQYMCEHMPRFRDFIIKDL